MSHTNCRMAKDCAALAAVLGVRFQGIAVVRSLVEARLDGLYGAIYEEREKCVPRLRSDTRRDALRPEAPVWRMHAQLTSDLFWGERRPSGAGSEPRETGDRGSTAGQATLTRGFGPL